MKNICYEMYNPRNSDCDYCISSDIKGIEEYPYEEIIAVIKKLSPQRVVLDGGESLIDKDLIPKLELLCQNYLIVLFHLVQMVLQILIFQH